MLEEDDLDENGERRRLSPVPAAEGPSVSLAAA